MDKGVEMDIIMKIATVSQWYLTKQRLGGFSTSSDLMKHFFVRTCGFRPKNEKAKEL